MRKTRSWILSPPVLVALAACGAGAPSPVAPPSAPRVASTSVAPPALPVVDASPTERTLDQKTREDARAPLANALLHAYGNDFPKFSHDRKRIIFGSNRDGNRQYYVSLVGDPSGAPVAVTSGPERGAAGAFTRDGRSVLFLRDAGVDENYRIYKVGLDGKNLTCLTPAQVRRRSRPIEPAGKPGTIVYWQREAKSPATDIVVQTFESGGAASNASIGEPVVVYTDPKPTSLPDVTKDAKRALILRRYSSSDYVLFELELTAGHKLRRLYPEEGTKAAVHSAAYSPDGKRAYVAADDGADGQFLFAIDLASGKISRRYRQSEPPTASVASVVVSPLDDRLAIVVHAGDHTEARILDAKSLNVLAKVNTPLGWVDLTDFSDDGEKIGATLSQADVPADIFAIDAKSGAVEPLRHDVRPGLGRLDPMETSIASVTAFDGLTIPVIVHLPGGADGARSSGKRLPVIVEFHGGPADSATVDWDTFARFFTSLGYAYVQPNVRGSTGYGRAFEMADNRERRADWLKDLETVNAWAKAQTWANPERVIAMGGSYGGYSVLMALTRQPSLWRAGVEYVGIANLFTFLRSTSQWLRAVWVDEFGDLDKDAALLSQFSPLRDVDKIVAPLYVYAGQNDPRVPREESDQVVLALRERRVPVEYQVAANEGHSLDHRENRVEFMTRVARFLDDHAR